MSLENLIFIFVIFLVILVMILFPEARTLLKGFTRIFIKDMAQTAEGAAAIYSEKIDQAQEAYNKADDSLTKMAGKLANTEKELRAKQEQLKKIESECEALVKAGKIDLAQIKSEEREEVVSEINKLVELVKVYTNAHKTAKEVHTVCEKNLIKLKKERNEVVENIKVKTEMKAVYDDINELKNVTGTDKALDYVREKNKDLDEIVAGAKAVHDNKLSTKISKAEEEARKVSSNDYLENLKKKYNK